MKISTACHGGAMATLEIFKFHPSKSIGHGRFWPWRGRGHFGQWLAMAGPWRLWRFLYIPPLQILGHGHFWPWRGGGDFGQWLAMAGPWRLWAMAGHGGATVNLGNGWPWRGHSDFGQWLAMAGPRRLWRFLYIPPLQILGCGRFCPWRGHGDFGDFHGQGISLF